MQPATVVRTIREEEVRAKFFRLLETEREGPEFDRLYREVDEALGELAAAEDSGRLGGPPRMQEAEG